MSQNNDSVDKLADEYSKTEDDKAAYIKAQTSTIISQTKEINHLKRELEKVAAENEKLSMELVQLKAVGAVSGAGSEGQFDTSSEETICVVQLEILKNMAMTRELTLEETKKAEIFTKTLLMVRGKKPIEKEEDKVEKLSNEDLLKMMEAMGKEDN